MTWGGKVSMAAGLLLLIVAALISWRAYHFVTTAEHAVGIVVRSAPDEPGNRSPGHPIIQFVTADGRTVRAHQHSGASVLYGAHLPVLYRRVDPEGATMASFWSIWAVPIVLVWLGLVLSVGPLLGLRLTLLK